MRYLLKPMVTVVLLMLVTGGLFATAAGETTAAPEERLTITVMPFTPRGTTLAPDSPTELWIEETYNVELEPWYGIDNYDSEAITVREMAGDVPHWGGCRNEVAACVDVGIIREIPQDLIREHMPNWMRWADHYLGEEVWRRTEVDGVNYAIPVALSMASTGQTFGFRADWMRAVGVEPEPVPDRDFYKGPDSLAEIEDMLLKFRNEDPDGNGQKDSWGYMVWKNNADFQRTVFPNVLGAFGVQWQVWDERNGQGYYSLVDPHYRDALKYINRWWEMEIIHPDMPTAVRADVVRAMANDEFGAWEELDAWMSSFTAGPWGALVDAHPDAEVAYSITPVGPTGQRGTWYRDPNWGPETIGITASDEVMIKIMQILEDQWTNVDRYARVFFGGDQGETWQVDDNGYRVAIPGTGSAADAASGAALGVRLISPLHIVPPIDKVYIAPHRHALQSWLEQVQTPGPGIGFRPVWNEDERALIANIKTIEQEFAWKALTGAVNIDAAWDDYVQDMMNAGLDRLLQTVASQGM